MASFVHLTTANRIAIFLGLYAFCGGLISFLGWGFAIPRFIDWDGNGISIKPNAALSAIFASASLLLLTIRLNGKSSKTELRRKLILLLGSLLVLIGGCTLLENITGLNFGIDTLLFDETPGARATIAPGRMGIPGSLSFTMLGLSFVLVSLNQRTRQWVVLPVVVALCISTFSLIAYLFGASPLYATAGLTGIAMQTASMIFAVSLGLIVSLLDLNPMRLLLEDSAAGIFARRALPFVFVLPPLLGWLRGKGETLGYYDTATGRSLLIMTLMFMLTLLLWRALLVVQSHELALTKAYQERLQVQQKLHETEARAAAMLESISDGFHALNQELRFTYFNQAATRMYAEQGVDTEPLLGQEFFTIFPDARELPVARALQECYTKRIPREVENFYPAWNRWYNVRHYPANNGGVATFFVDITERKQAEVALQQSEKNLAAELEAAQYLQEISTQLIQSTNDPAFYEQVLDTALAIMHSQFASIQMLQQAEGTETELLLLGQRGFNPAATLFWERVRPASKSSCGAALISSKRVIVSDVEQSELMKGSDDLKTYLQTGIRAVQTTPLLSREGKMLGMISTHWNKPYEPAERELRLMDILARIVADLLERRQIEEALREADRRKDEFLATLAHELRNPLAPVKNSLELMKHAQGDPSLIEESRSTMERQLRHLARLIDDLLDVSRITRNRLELKTERVELASTIHHTLEACQPLAQASGHIIQISLPAEPIYLEADPVRLAQIFGNILNNACKYTARDDRISLTVTREGSDVVIAVTDSGEGISPEMLPHVFEMFTQVNHTLERSQGGLGIGLSLVKRLVELHGGTVTAQSQGLGRGSTFTVRLPILTATQPVAAVSLPTKNHQLVERVLVVDDNRDSALTLSMLLKIQGCEIQTAYDGGAAVSQAKLFQPELILLDIGLPVMNGYDACRAIRNEPWGQNMIMIALTGWGQDEDRRKSREAGFDGHLVKPVEYATLASLVTELKSKKVVVVSN